MVQPSFTTWYSALTGPHCFDLSLYSPLQSLDLFTARHSRLLREEIHSVTRIFTACDSLINTIGVKRPRYYESCGFALKARTLLINSVQKNADRLSLLESASMDALILDRLRITLAEERTAYLRRLMFKGKLWSARP